VHEIKSTYVINVTSIGIGSTKVRNGGCLM